jgi:hypothetical protein
MGLYDRSATRISDLIGMSGQIAAERAQRQGAAADRRASQWSGLFNTVAQTASTAIQANKQEKEKKREAEQMAKRDAAWTEAVETWDGKDPKALYGVANKIFDPKTAAQMTQAAVSFQQMSGKGDEQDAEHAFNIAQAIKAGKITPPMLERWGASLQQKMAGVAKQFGMPDESINQPWTPQQFAEGADMLLAMKGGEPAKPIEVSPGASLVDPTGKPLYTAPTAQKPAATHKVTVAGPDGKPMEKLVTEDELKAGIATYQAPRTRDDEPLVAVMGDDGQPVMLPRSQAAGKRPASGREQGRPVTSGDAGRIADYKTSLDDLAVLSKTLGGNKATGAAAQVGAAVPNAVTELTGWGADAKSKQATIDRVKQVIGKALEGGVLRKEDESKYEKILPTIGDPPAVVATKLAGLKDAIERRQQTFTESLADAGFDTTQFEARGGGAPLATHPWANAKPSGPSGAPPKKRNPFR